MAAIQGWYVLDIIVTSSRTVTTYVINHATSKYSGGFSHIITVKKMYIINNRHMAL